jgi:hypothetical protein
LKFPLPATLKLNRVIDFVDWFGEMDTAQRRTLRQVLAAHAAHGRGYKRYLPQNREWLQLAKGQAVELDAWLSPDAATHRAPQGPLRIEVSQYPWDIFQMGSYFCTCLSLGDSNEMSVLANAYDANKQVIFVRDEQGVIVARQLVAISEDWRLLGYSCYCVFDHSDESRRDACMAAVADYCGRWARRIGVPLGGEGKPAEIGGHFWYDDGTHGWHESANLAWQMAEPTVSRPIVNHETMLVG